MKCSTATLPVPLPVLLALHLPQTFAQSACSSAGGSAPQALYGRFPRTCSTSFGRSHWLALVEQIPAGAEGTPVARNLVKNLHQQRWNIRSQLSKKELINLPRSTRWVERRPMQMASSTDPTRLAPIGWMQDTNGQVVAAARAECAAAKP